MFSTSSGDDFALTDDDCIFHLELWWEEEEETNLKQKRNKIC
jgi:hypothetical protein